jgi:pyruvate-formate lyase-activating enzyme
MTHGATACRSRSSRQPPNCASTATDLKVMPGGFTLCGGKPLMQHRFVVKLVAAGQALGIHTAVQTNGYDGEKLSDA